MNLLLTFLCLEDTKGPQSSSQSEKETLEQNKNNEIIVNGTNTNKSFIQNTFL